MKNVVDIFYEISLYGEKKERDLNGSLFPCVIICYTLAVVDLISRV